MRNETAIPPALAAIAAGRDYITTREFAKVINKAPQTIRKLHSQTGEAYGIRSVKIGNEHTWPVVRVGCLVTGGQ